MRKLECMAGGFSHILKKKFILLVLIFSLTNCGLPFSEKKDNRNQLLQLLLLAYLIENGLDPLFGDQWHLKNTGSTTGSVAGEDANVEPVWNQGLRGEGITIVVVDDGVDNLHEDLSPNINRNLQIDFTDQLPNLKNGEAPCTSNVCHGTAVAGILSARDNNNRGGRGAVPRASISGRNILFSATSTNIARAMSEKSAQIFVSNNSWGATDYTGNFNAELGDSNWQSAIDTAVSRGRNGLGTLFFWSAGNGGKVSPLANNLLEIDNSNQDGQANYHGVFSICATGNDGQRAYYSEQGANLLVCAPSEGNNGVAITTTDIMGEAGFNTSSTSTNLANKNYNKFFNGTSAASPLAAGVGALVLQANPNLSWRDVRLILARSARKVDTTDSDWQTNGARLSFNHKYGFGVVDALSAVNLARNWSNVRPAFTIVPPTSGLAISAPTNYSIGNSVKRGTVRLAGDNGGTARPIASENTIGLNVQTQNITVTSSGMGRIEFVEVTLSTTTNPGDLIIELQSPSGTSAILQFPHPCFPTNSNIETACSPYSNWRFGVTKFMDEPADGIWRLSIADGANGMNPFGLRSPTVNHNATPSGVSAGWSLRIRGRAN